MSRTRGAALFGVLVLATVTACGGSSGGSSDGTSAGASTSDYCTDLRHAQASLVGLIDNQIDQRTFESLRPQLRTIAAAAPSGIAADWTTFSTAVDKFSAALDRAGLTMNEMRDMGSGHMGGGAQMRQAMNAARALGSVAVSNAQSAIFRNAHVVCHVDLNR